MPSGRAISREPSARTRDGVKVAIGGERREFEENQTPSIDLSLYDQPVPLLDDGTDTKPLATERRERQLAALHCVGTILVAVRLAGASVGTGNVHVDTEGVGSVTTEERETAKHPQFAGRFRVGKRIEQKLTPTMWREGLAVCCHRLVQGGATPGHPPGVAAAQRRNDQSDPKNPAVRTG